MNALLAEVLTWIMCGMFLIYAYQTYKATMEAKKLEHERQNQ